MPAWANFFLGELGASATLTAFLAAFADAWVLMIEINR